MGGGRLCLGITKAVKTETGTEVEDNVHVVIERDTDERTVYVPEDLAVAPKRAHVTAVFEAIAYTHRNEYARRIAEAKRTEIRQRRIAKAIEMITVGDRLS
jgi:uncharacterized protein YdeI (YjbR/CyaY-like superfamily)